MHGVSGEGPHARSATRFLTGVSPQPDQGTDLQAGISSDQIAARVLGQKHNSRPLSWPLMGVTLLGRVTMGSVAPTRTQIFWANDTTPLPMENNPRVFLNDFLVILEILTPPFVSAVG
ncbi:MAG: hypothetical protein Ct9H300mP25_09760 [Acidobacteriota bacterium]|nr:MAG: hypothetical protein Ct9H300mP25_09760 [Acidobacteriota bacterium]